MRDTVHMSPAARLTGLLLVAVFHSGFLNLITTHGLYPATLLIDGITIAMTVIGLTALLRRGARLELWMGWLFALCAAYVVLAPISPEPLSHTVASFRSQVLYAFIAIFVALTLKGHPDERDRLVSLMMRLFVFIAIFGIFQYLFRARLPQWLLFSRDTTLFGYYGSDITRSTGLLGNTIVFGAVLTLGYALHFARFISRPSMATFLPVPIMGLSVLTTFSRAAIALTGLITIVTLVLVLGRRNAAAAYIGGLLTLVIGAPIAFVIGEVPAVNRRVHTSFIINALFGEGNASVQQSTAGHYQLIQLATQTMHQHPLTGIGIGTQALTSDYAQSNPVITDGAVWARFVEGGLMVVVPYTLLLLAVMAVAWRTWVRTWSWEAIGLLVFSVFEFGVASLYNSGFFGKPTFVLFWIAFGLICASRTEIQPETRAHHRERVAVLLS